MLKKLRAILRTDKYQRIIYGVLFLLWVSFSLIAKDDWWRESDLNISYFYLFLMPTILLLTQLLFNLRIVWLFTLTLWILFVLFSIWRFASDLYERLRWTVKGNYSLIDYLFVLGYFGILIFLMQVIYEMQPGHERKYTA